MQRIIYIAIFVVFFPTLATATTSIGVINLDEDTLAVADILTVKLSQQPGLIALERDQIRQILQEQQLSLSGLTSTRDSIAAGRLIDADALVFLETVATEKEQFVAIRLVSVKHAAIFEDLLLGFPENDIETYCEAVIKELSGSLEKLKITLKQLSAVSIIDFKNVVAIQGIPLESYLEALVRRRLHSNSNLVVVEREQLDEVFYEKTLSKQATVDFLKGALLIDGSIDEDKQSDDFTLNLRVRSPEASKSFKFSGNKKNLKSILDNINNAIADSVGFAGEQSWNPKKEAREFTFKAEGHLRSGLYEKALALSNAAWALGARDWDTVRVRSDALIYNILNRFEARRGRDFAYGLVGIQNGIIPINIRASDKFPIIRQEQVEWALELLSISESDFFRLYNNRFHRDLIEPLRQVFFTISLLIYIDSSPEQTKQIDGHVIEIFQEGLIRIFRKIMEDPDNTLPNDKITEVLRYVYFWFQNPEETTEFISEVFQKVERIYGGLLDDPRTAALWQKKVSTSRKSALSKICRYTLIDFYLPLENWQNMPFPSSKENSIFKEKLQRHWHGYLEKYALSENQLLSIIAYFALSNSGPHEKFRFLDIALEKMYGFILENKEELHKGYLKSSLHDLEGIMRNSFRKIKWEWESVPSNQQDKTLAIVYKIITLMLSEDISSYDFATEVFSLFSEEDLRKLCLLASEKQMTNYNNFAATVSQSAKHYFSERYNYPIEQASNTTPTLLLERLPVFFRGSFAQGATYANNRLWIFNHNTIFSVDVVSQDMETIKVPNDIFLGSNPNDVKLAVGNKHLLITRRSNGFAIYNFQNGSWRHFSDPISVSAACFFNDKFFIGFSSGVIVFDPESETRDILCSSRRSPALTPLDDTSNYRIYSMIPYDNNSILLSLAGKGSGEINGSWKINYKDIEFERFSEKAFSYTESSEGYFVHMYNKTAYRKIVSDGNNPKAGYRFSWDDLGYFIHPSENRYSTSVINDLKQKSSGEWILEKPMHKHIYDGKTVWLSTGNFDMKLLALKPGVENLMEFNLEFSKENNQLQNNGPRGQSIASLMENQITITNRLNLDEKNRRVQNNRPKENIRASLWLWTPMGLVFASSSNEIWYLKPSVLDDAVDKYSHGR